jgi:histidine triad (HIT) family protein
MYNHAPEDYICPFCLLVRGIKNEHVYSVATDVFYHDDAVMAFINSYQWPNNPGSAVVIPNQHFENLYDLPLYLAAKIHELARAVALAMKAVYGCDGISTRQHNEPDGNQDVWHYHLHVFPRYQGDRLYFTRRQLMAPEERAGYAGKLRTHLAGWKPAAAVPLSANS